MPLSAKMDIVASFYTWMLLQWKPLYHFVVCDGQNGPKQMYFWLETSTHKDEDKKTLVVMHSLTNLFYFTILIYANSKLYVRGNDIVKE